MVPELASKTEQKRMTKSEFEQWLAGHYDALVQRVGRGKRGLACEESLTGRHLRPDGRSWPSGSAPHSSAHREELKVSCSAR